MNTLTTWEMDELPARLLGLCGLSLSQPADAGEEAMAFVEWMPLVDISERENEWCLKADLPDVKTEHVSVTLRNGVLSLAGKRKFEKTERRREYHCMECTTGTFARSFQLPEGADGNRAVAEHTGGVLTVRVPKKKR